MDILNDPRVIGKITENQVATWYTQYLIVVDSLEDFMYLLETYTVNYEVPIEYPHDVLKKPLQAGDHILYANAAKDSSLKRSVLEEDPSGGKYSISFYLHERDEQLSHTKYANVKFNTIHPLLCFKMKNGKYKPVTNRDIVKIDL